MRKSEQGGAGPSLAETLAMVMHVYRQAGGYSIAAIDHALGEAIVLEAMQRTALLVESPPGKTPELDAVAEILHQVLSDVRGEALAALRRSAH